MPWLLLAIRHGEDGEEDLPAPVDRPDQHGEEDVHGCEEHDEEGLAVVEAEDPARVVEEQERDVQDHRHVVEPAADMRQPGVEEHAPGPQEEGERAVRDGVEAARGHRSGRREPRAPVAVGDHEDDQAADRGDEARPRVDHLLDRDRVPRERLAVAVAAFQRARVGLAGPAEGGEHGKDAHDGDELDEAPEPGASDEVRHGLAPTGTVRKSTPGASPRV